ncbi:MAG: enoyl-CoA hydratase [Hydrogenophaga sp.]|uniref:enoyl-CoA hydratase n=1 Tax=Hydrogenophaga sp. TaxID=1904254 RepID=UPI0027345517|nr:enoyl-CoA hydratase [Hydrogenophaga sp.]MDP3626413.1 enoyl-CoA hydratase [Hydrogenophaga sp.]
MTDTTTTLLVSHPLPGCALLTLNRPQALNALSAALRGALVQALQTLDADDSVRVVVLTGAGRSFCSGLDLRELGTEGVPTLGGANDPVRALTAFGKPMIAAVNGAAVTGGFELALACDLLLASTKARFADTHARIGVIPGWGLSQKLSRLIGLPRAKEMAFSGNFIDAETAERWGLVNRVLSPDALLPAALALAADIASAEPGMLRAYKRLIDEGFDLPMGEAMALEARRSSERAAAQTPEELARRREAVQERGRAQAG